MSFELIGCSKDRAFGQPSLKGRRLTVFDIVTKLFYEESIEVGLEDYQISLMEAKAAVKYCMNLGCQIDQDLIHFCDGCLLRTLQEKWDFRNENYSEMVYDNDKRITISKNGLEIFLGTVEELENSEFGKVTWLIANEVYKKL